MFSVAAAAAVGGSAPAEAATQAPIPDLLVDLPDGVLQIVALSDRAVRVRFTRQAPAHRVPASPILLDTRPAARPRRRSLRGGSRLELPFLTCDVEGDGRVSFRDRDGRLLLREAAGARGLTPGRLYDESVMEAEQAFESPSDERLFGTGCFQDGALDLRGLPRRLTQVNTQISLPFLLSSRGYGLLWHNMGMSELNTPAGQVVLTRQAVGDARTSNVTTSNGGAQVTRREAVFEGRFTLEAPRRLAFLLDIGRKMASRYHVEIDGRVVVDFANLWLPPTTGFFAELEAGVHQVTVRANESDAPQLRFGPAQDRTVWRSPVAEAIDYVVIAGPSADEIMSGYRDLLGAASMPPRWALGYIHCRERFHSSAEILDTLKEFRRRRLPVDVMVQDWQYWGRYGWNAMRFDEANYPDPAGMIRDIHALGARFMLSVWSKVGRETELGGAVAQRGFYIPGTEWVDFFNPAAADFYCANQNSRLGVLGVDAWWQDATEPENDDLVGRVTAAGRGEHVRLTYALQVSRAVYEARRRAAPDQRVMILTRSAFLGQHRYGAATWSGDIGSDWETLARQIPAGLNMAAAGYPYWTVDAGGFFRPGPGQYDDPDYHERFLRWFQYATFLPLQRVHGYQTDTEFWRFGEQVETVARRYLELRYRMLPYIYSAAGETTRSGAPPMRPLVFDFPNDPRALDQVHSYMFGRAIHVAPVLKPGVGAWDVYLPRSEGGWIDLWTGQRRAGGGAQAVEAPVEQIPLHARAGAILPFGPVLQSTAEATGEAINLYVCPGRDGAFDLYEDNGLDHGYERGASSLIPMRWDDRRGELRLGARRGAFPGMLGTRTFMVRRLGPGCTPLTPGAAPGTPVTYAGAPITLRLG